MDNLIDYNTLSKLFMCCANLKEFDWKHILDNLPWEEQVKFLEMTVHHPLVLKYPLHSSYQINFLKQVIKHLEKHKAEIHDDIYNTYCRLNMETGKTITFEKNSHFSYKHYVISDSITVSLKESSNLISNGTTGLHSWEASLVLSEWCLQNRRELENTYILELGSGAGLAGLIIGKCCDPKQIWLTDCHPNVLNLLVDNLFLNFEGKNEINYNEHILCKLKTNLDVEIGVLKLPWEDLTNGNHLKTIVIPDIVLAADVVFDSSVFSALCSCFEYFIKSNPRTKIILVCTVRNEDTLEDFINLLGVHKISALQIENPSPKHLFWPSSLRAKIFVIHSL